VGIAHVGVKVCVDLLDPSPMTCRKLNSDRVGDSYLRSARPRLMPMNEIGMMDVDATVMQSSISTQEGFRETLLDSVPSDDQVQSMIGEETNRFNTRNEAFSNSIIDEIALDHSLFMKVPSKDALDAIIGDFIDRTGNTAMAMGVCAVCAREMSKRSLTVFRLDSVPNPNRLKPAVAHPAHDMFNDMLLHPTGLSTPENVNICSECIRALNSDNVPMFALANGLWVGRVPHELAYLTLPERLLIAKYFPAAYIVKLYPKKKGARHWDRRQMYSGLKGNVSTYQLDQGQISSMIDGSIMPQQASVLAATIGITFVGPKNLPDKGLPEMFKVRRVRVHRALEWLKANNPLYSNITISTSRLAALPENDVPIELRATTKLSTNISKLHAEHDGYVPSQETRDDESDEGGGFFFESLSFDIKVMSQSPTQQRMKVGGLIFSPQ
jgi:hypothetical protein